MHLIGCARLGFVTTPISAHVRVIRRVSAPIDANFWHNCNGQMHGITLGERLAAIDRREGFTSSIVRGCSLMHEIGRVARNWMPCVLACWKPLQMASASQNGRARRSSFVGLVQSFSTSMLLTICVSLPNVGFVLSHAQALKYVSQDRPSQEISQSL